MPTTCEIRGQQAAARRRSELEFFVLNHVRLAQPASLAAPERIPPVTRLLLSTISTVGPAVTRRIATPPSNLQPGIPGLEGPAPGLL